MWLTKFMAAQKFFFVAFKGVICFAMVLKPLEYKGRDIYPSHLFEILLSKKIFDSLWFG